MEHCAKKKSSGSKAEKLARICELIQCKHPEQHSLKNVQSYRRQNRNQDKTDNQSYRRQNRNQDKTDKKLSGWYSE